MAARGGVLPGFETMETTSKDAVGKAMACLVCLTWGVYPDIGSLKNAAALYGSYLFPDLEIGRGHTYAANLKETFPRMH